MKKIYVLAISLLLIQSCAKETVFELQPSQSMSITGKGPGQDAAINPYSDRTSRAIVKNLGKNEFKVRIQNDGKIIKYVTINPNNQQEFILPKGYELYLDSDREAKAFVDFKKYKSANNTID